MVEPLLLLPKDVGSNPGRPIFLSLYCKLLLFICCKLNLKPKLYFLFNKILKMSKNDKNKDFFSSVNQRMQVRVRAGKGKSDSMNDFILIVFSGFAIKNDVDSEIPRP